MTTTTSSTITFSHPFTLEGAGGPWPAGSYDLDVDEEMVDGMSFPVARRTAAILYLPGNSPGMLQAVHTHPDVLDAALRADAGRDAAGQAEPEQPSPALDMAGRDRPGEDTDRSGWLTPPFAVPALFAVMIALAALFGPFTADGRIGPPAGPQDEPQAVSPWSASG